MCGRRGETWTLPPKVSKIAGERKEKGGESY